jgi:hypothetical protein
MTEVSGIVRWFRNVGSGSLEKTKAMWETRKRLDSSEVEKRKETRNCFLLGILKKYSENMDVSVRKLGPFTEYGREFSTANSLQCFFI